MLCYGLIQSDSHFSDGIQVQVSTKFFKGLTTTHLDNELRKVFNIFGLEESDGIGARKSPISDIKFKVNFKFSDQIRKIEAESLNDPRLEKLDPNPDIQIMFKEYDERYFNGFLSYNEVEVRWNDDMPKSMGNCHHEKL